MVLRLGLYSQVRSWRWALPVRWPELGGGEGVPQDYVSAYVWFHLAAAQGYIMAIKNRDSAKDNMTRAQIAEAQKLSRELLADIPSAKN